MLHEKRILSYLKILHVLVRATPALASRACSFSCVPSFFPRIPMKGLSGVILSSWYLPCVHVLGSMSVKAFEALMACTRYNPFVHDQVSPTQMKLEGAIKAQERIA